MDIFISFLCLKIYIVNNSLKGKCHFFILDGTTENVACISLKDYDFTWLIMRCHIGYYLHYCFCARFIWKVRQVESQRFTNTINRHFQCKGCTTKQSNLNIERNIVGFKTNGPCKLLVTFWKYSETRLIRIRKGPENWIRTFHVFGWCCHE